MAMSAPTKPKEGASCHISNPPASGTQNAGETKDNGGGKIGGPRAKPPWRGAWGVSPHKIKRGSELPTLATPPASGAQNAIEPKASGGGQNGGPGGKAPSQGVWGMCPQEFKRGGELPTLATPPRVGPKTPANPKPTGVGKTGVQGAKPPGRGFGGCAPKNLKEGASCPH